MGVGQSVISTSTTTPSRLSQAEWPRHFFAEYAIDVFVLSASSALALSPSWAAQWEFPCLRDHDFLRDFAVDGLYVIVAAAVVKNSYYRGMAAHHRAHDAAFGAAIGAGGDDIDQNLIAVHGVADGVRRE